MLLNRFFLSLAAALFVSTVASANSTNVTTAFLHSGASNSATYAGYFSTIGEKTSPTVLVAQTSHTSTGAIGNPSVGAAPSGRLIYGQGATAPAAGGILFPQRRYGPICCEARNWVGSGRGPGSLGPGSQPGLSTPEPGSLMLLSTGLMGIAGMVRRKLRLG